IDVEFVSKRYAEWREFRLRIEELERSEQDRLRLIDLWSFQKKEIDAAKLQLGEDSRLETERRALQNAEKLFSAALGAYDLLYESANSALATLRSAAHKLEELARFDPQFGESVRIIESARADIEDVSATTRDYADGIDASPQRLAELEDRL